MIKVIEIIAKYLQKHNTPPLKPQYNILTKNITTRRYFVIGIGKKLFSLLTSLPIVGHHQLVSMEMSVFGGFYKTFSQTFHSKYQFVKYLATRLSQDKIVFKNENRSTLESGAGAVLIQNYHLF